jgi:hypothetical protein
VIRLCGILIVVVMILVCTSAHVAKAQTGEGGLANPDAKADQEIADAERLLTQPHL